MPLFSLRDWTRVAIPLVAILASTHRSSILIAWSDDVAELKNGGTVAGDISIYEKSLTKDQAVQGQLVKMSGGLTIALPEVEIRRVRSDDLIAEYQQRLIAMPDTAAGHWEMSQWCNGQRLHDQNERHLRRVIELEPNHGGARQLLGYAPNGNGWVKDTALRRERGMLRDEGKWRLAEDVLVLRAMDDANKARKEWVRNLQRLKKQVVKGGTVGQDALRQIQEIDDPRADEAIVDQFTKGEDAQRFPRLMWLEILGRLRTGLAMNAIIEAAMNDASASVRERCIELLQIEGKYQAIPYYVSKLSDPNNKIVNRAGEVLQELNDPEIALALVEAIWTKHEQIIAAGNETNVSMSRDGSSSGGGGLQTGGGPQKISGNIRNPAVYAALLELVPDDVDFQYDKERWRLYFASQRAASLGDLRRDP